MVTPDLFVFFVNKKREKMNDQELATAITVAVMTAINGIPKKRWTKEDIKTLLLTNDRAVERAILAIQKLQSEDELRSHSTIHKNNVGWQACHARKAMKYARWIQLGNRITGRHMVDARNMVLKYTRQLAAISNG